MKYILRITTIAAVIFCSTFDLHAQTPITICPDQATFSSMSRGYYFTAPTDFVICGLYVEDDRSTGAQSVEIVRFTAGPPPAYAATTNNFVSLFYQNNYVPNNMIPVPNISISAGEVIGIYGSRGAAVNSYGQAACPAVIGGFPVTLFRSGMQNNLGAMQMQNIWSENGPIGRVTMYTGCCPPPIAIPAITGPATACAGDAVTYSVPAQTGATAYNWVVPAVATITSGQNTTSINVTWNSTPGGDICVDWSDPCGTSPQTCLNVPVNPLPQAGGNGNITYCAADPPSDLFAQLSGTPDATGTWSPALASGTGVFDPALDAPGTYTYTVTNPCGTVSATVDVTVNPMPDSGIDGAITYCGADPASDLFAELTGTPDATGTWSPAMSSGTGVFNPALDAAGTYTYTVTNFCGTVSSVVDVTVNPVPNAGTNGAITYCASDASSDLFGQLGGTPDATGTWSPAMSSGTGVFNPAVDPGGTYTYTVTNSCGTIASVVDVTVNPEYNLSESFDICSGTNYTFPDGSTQTNITASTSYVSNMTTAVGCDSIITTNLNVISVFNVTEAFNICEGTDYTYPDGTLSTNIIVNESHLSVLMSSLGCDSNVTTNLTVDPITTTTVAITVCENGTATYPDGSTEIITANTSQISTLTSVAGCDSLVVTNVTMDPITTTNININVCENASTTYPDGSSEVITGNTTQTSTLSSINGCDSLVVTAVTMDPLPDAGSNGALSICPAGAPSDLYNELGGTPDIGGSWSPALSSGTGVFDPAVDGAGTYTYTVTNPCGTISADVVVSMEPDPNPGTNGTLTVCSTDAAVDLFTLLGGNPDGGGVWNPALASGTGVFNPAIDLGGVYSYDITNSCGTFSAQVDVTNNLADDASFSYSSNVFCLNATDPTPTSIGTGGGVFTITGSGVIDPVTGVIDIVASGVGGYAVTYTTNGPCPDATTIQIAIDPIGDPSILPVGPFCEYDDPITLTPVQSGGLWSGPGVDPSTGVFDPSQASAGINTITYTLLGACGGTGTVQIIVNPTPTVNTISDTTINLGQSVTLSTTGSGGVYTWTPDLWLDCTTCEDPISTPEDDFIYYVSLEEFGCVGMDVVTINVVYEPIVWLPNIFSPNGDNHNDVLYVRGKGVIDMTFIVYDRWGEKVFESTSLNDGWDGTFRGKEMNHGVFMYYLSANMKDGTNVILKGDVTLIR